MAIKATNNNKSTTTKQADSKSRGFIIKNSDGQQLGFFSINKNIPMDIQEQLTIEMVQANLADCTIEEYVNEPKEHYNPFAKK